jgi:hypothetical protein
MPPFFHRALSRTTWQFSLRALFLLTLMVASFFAGWTVRSRQLAKMLAQQQEQAESARRTAQAAIDQLIVQTAQSLQPDPTGDQLRKELLERAQSFHESSLPAEEEVRKALQGQSVGAPDG